MERTPEGEAQRQGSHERMVQGEHREREETHVVRETTAPASPETAAPAQSDSEPAEGGADRESSEEQAETTDGK